jgi:hypothetical protein
MCAATDKALEQSVTALSLADPFNLDVRRHKRLV